MFPQDLTRRAFLGGVLTVPIALSAASEDWIPLFDGRTLNGWRPSENKGSWKVVDGMLAANGPRSHLFYDGPVHSADFRNFELEVELITKPQCNSGVYFHTAYQESGFPDKGFEIQVNNTALGDGGYLERKKTGSLYGLRNMYKQLVPDEKPFRIRASVRGKNVQIRLNGELVVDYVEPTPPVIPEGGEKHRFLDHGTFALQCHNDGSKASFKSVRVRPLPDDLPAYAGPPPVVDEVYREVIDIGRHNVPMVDYNVFLRDGMTLDDALRKSRADGIQYGITANASAFKSDADAARWLQPLIGKPVFLALSTDNGNWTRTLSRDTARRFDYILAHDQAPGSVGIDKAIDHAVKRLDTQPIDICSPLQPEPRELWTQPRMSKLIAALARNKVAIELNTVLQSPPQAFIQLAKEAGCKLAYGTGNETSAQLKRCEYGLQMTETCKLDWHNFYAPGAWRPKAVDRRWPAQG